MLQNITFLHMKAIPKRMDIILIICLQLIGKHPNKVTFSEKTNIQHNISKLYETFTQVKLYSSQLTLYISGFQGHFTQSQIVKCAQTLPKYSKNFLKRAWWLSPFWKLEMSMILVCMNDLDHVHIISDSFSCRHEIPSDIIALFSMIRCETIF